MPDAQTGAGDEDLHLFLQENISLLLGIVRSYVVRMGLARGEAVQSVATDILQDAVFEALAHAERFKATTSPRAWFLAIAANIIKRRKVEAAKRHEREVYMGDLSTHHPEAIDERDFFDQFTARSYPGPEQAFEADESVVEMLSLVSTDDQAVLRLALLLDLDMRTLAERLGVTPGTARVRLHRALNRLRKAWNRHKNESERGERHV